MDRVFGKLISVMLPYCVQKLEDGRWIILNREYKPINYLHNVGWVDYGERAYKIKGLTKRVIEKVAFDGKLRHYKDCDAFFFYNDAGIGDDYWRRLQIFSKLRLE